MAGGRKKALPDSPRPFDGSRRHKLARWLQHPPERGHELRCIYRDGDGTEQVLQTWLRDVVDPHETSEAIETAIRDHTDEMKCACRGVIQWVSEDNKAVSSKPWRQYPAEEEQEFTGDLQSMLQQNQRHIEALVQYNVRAQSLVVEQLARTLDIVTQRFEDETKVSDTRDAELDELKEYIRQLEAKNDEKGDPNVERVLEVLQGAVAGGIQRRPNGQG